MLKKIIHFLADNYFPIYPPKLPFGRVEEDEGVNSPWDSPQREKFFISTEELKMVGMALNHYKKHLQNRKDVGKIQKLADLDDRVFGFLAFLEGKHPEILSFSE